MRRAQKAIEDISKHGKLPIVAGGTGFYIDALVGRITLADVPPNPTLRKKLTAKSAEQLFKILEKKDPDRAVSMNTPSERNNKLRLIRALEIAESRQPYGGRSSVKRSKTLSHNNEYSPLRRTVLRKGALTYDALWIGIIPTQQVLEKKISTRLLYRLRHGMIAEAKRLHATGLSYKRMGELGLEYRSLARFLQKNISRKELEEELVRDITRYTKKQMMYWNRNVDITWFKPTELKKIRSRISLWYKKP